MFTSTKTAGVVQQRQQSWGELPKAVKRYLQQVFAENKFGASAPMNIICSVDIEQEGLFLVNNVKWMNFTAEQTIAAESIGFLWEANLPLLNWLPPVVTTSSVAPSIRVYDALVNGKAYLVPSFMGVIPFPEDKNLKGHQSELLLGELLRWLTEATLIPTVLLPAAGVASWAPVLNEEQMAYMTVVEPFTGIEAKAKFTFDEKSGWPSKVQCMRPYGGPDGFALKPWIGYFSNYKKVNSMWIPAHMEAGWLLENDGSGEGRNNSREVLYFKGDNVKLKYKFGPPRGEQQETPSS